MIASSLKIKQNEKFIQELTLSTDENGKLIASFEPIKDAVGLSKQQKEAQDYFYKLFQEESGKALFHFGFMEKKGHLSATLNFWHDFSRIFINSLRLTEHLEELKDKAKVQFNEEQCCLLLSEAPYFTGNEYLDMNVLKCYWQIIEVFFKKTIKSYNGSVESFFKSFSETINIADKIYFHLVENKKGASAQFAFLATYSSETTGQGISRHRPLRSLINEYSGKQDKFVEMLGSVYKAANKSSLIKSMLESGEIFHPLSIDSSKAYTFLSETPVYEDSGILCRIPNWWKGARKGISISVKLGENERSLFGLESLIEFQTNLIVNGEKITQFEAEKILADSAGLTLIKGRWVAIDREKLKATLDKWKEVQELMADGEITLSDAVRLASGMENKLGTPGSESVNLETGYGEWMRSVIEKMQNPSAIRTTKISKSFKAELRHYQQIGVNWLGFLGSMNFGACLADDMGLGKTVQIIALLDTIKNDKKYSGTSLLVVPASLIHNWASEIRKFAPSLKFAFVHTSVGEYSIGTKPSNEEINKCDLIITTYGFVRTYQWLKEKHWRCIIIDEAQAIKNHASKQTQAVKSLKGDKRIALTGTPIENSLWDLWSIFDFLNPGLLGNMSQFKKFTDAKDEHSFGKIRKIITPYILRRLKSDKKIISELPDKIEMESYSKLSKRQLVLYKKQVDELKASLEKTAEGIDRKGLVLASLTRFKQICNHPSHYLGDGDFRESDSGKFERLREICETIRDKRERVLVFTQFKEMTEPLNDFLFDIFGKKGFVLHGGTNIKKRKEMVELFQSDEYYPFFVLSLKAGGTGLNLTRANHVMHFDRWWNPAVENQATDRAFRIGQKKSVLVHKFISEGTFEEKIDQALKDKAKLSDNILSNTEGVNLTELSNKEIINMFSIGSMYE